MCLSDFMFVIILNNDLCYTKTIFNIQFYQKEPDKNEIADIEKWCIPYTVETY